MSAYDGQIYRPKYHEDLVHSEIPLPSNAPKEYADRATLWNAVELSEKGQKSQLARMFKASLPNDWNSQENAKMWRKDLADTINATNEKLGINVHWEHRSFKEQGIDKEPTMQRNLSPQGR